jgi:hypothetical protein
MGPHAKKFFRFGRPFIYDCEYADMAMNAESADNFAFGIARELYVRDCYFRFLPDEFVRSARIVVDIGANRGAFSSMMTAVASKIVAVEADPDLEKVIRHNLTSNGFKDFGIEIAFIGDGGEQFDLAFRQITMEELFRKYKLDRVDLMKLGIEGSEFPLFRDPQWLDVVRALTMEVHPDFGDPSEVIGALGRRGFATSMADENLRPVELPAAASFIYAWRM